MNSNASVKLCVIRACLKDSTVDKNLIEYDNSFHISGQKYVNAASVSMFYLSFSKAYLGPYRTKERTTAHNKLVNEMKIMIERDLSKHYFI